jgi:hypothetical protein
MKRGTRNCWNFAKKMVIDGMGYHKTSTREVEHPIIIFTQTAIWQKFWLGG